MIIVLGSQKGGVGKSTLAVSIAAYLMSARCCLRFRLCRSIRCVYRLLITCSFPFRRDSYSGQPSVIHITTSEHEKSYDFVIADCAGRDSAEMRSGLMAADVFISPLRPSQMDLDVVPHTCSVFTAAKDFNEDVRGYLVLNMTPTNMFVNEANEAAEVLKDYPEMHLANSRVCDRKAHRDAWAESMTIFETQNDKAQQEIEALVKEVIL